MSDDQKKATDREWAQRVLCSDESCIGVIGPDGRCKECGKRYEGELPVDMAVADEAAAPSDGTEAPDAHPDGEEEQAQADDEWAQRRLCSDESCIGVIGPDGRCKECGKAAD